MMQILLYQGRSLVSKAIRKQTDSIYSHAAVRMRDGSIIEAWQGVGVRQMKTVMDGHTPGTPVTVFHIDGEYEEDAVEAFLLKQVGKKYDYLSVARFITRWERPSNDKWFCSELVVAAFRKGGLDLLNGPAAKISPRDVSLSPLLQEITTLGART
jgi:uncharacterized protein YycO